MTCQVLASIGCLEILKLINETNLSIKITTQNNRDVKFKILKTDLVIGSFSAILYFNTNVSSLLELDEIEIFVKNSVYYSDEKMKITLNKGESSKI